MHLRHRGSNAPLPASYAFRIGSCSRPRPPRANALLRRAKFRVAQAITVVHEVSDARGGVLAVFRMSLKFFEHCAEGTRVELVAAVLGPIFQAPAGHRCQRSPSRTPRVAPWSGPGPRCPWSGAIARRPRSKSRPHRRPSPPGEAAKPLRGILIRLLVARNCLVAQKCNRCRATACSLSQRLPD